MTPLTGCRLLYQDILNQIKFICPLDAETTKANIFYIKKKFIRFCRNNEYGKWELAIKARNCEKGLIMSFLYWICEIYKTVNQYWRDFKMLYCRANKGAVINPNDCEEIVKYINGNLKVGFGLDNLPKPKPVMGVNDLLLGLIQHWCRDILLDVMDDTELDEEGLISVNDPNEEAGVWSQPLLLPEDRGIEIVRKYKALCYEDLTLWIVKDPTKKGLDNKPKPTVFLFREYLLPILCSIIDGYSFAELFFSTQLGKDAVKVCWKPLKLKSPVFRKSVRIDEGGWEKSPIEPMKYATYAFYLDRIGRDLGSEEKWMSYCMRRVNAYLNHRVGFNVQDAYLERDLSADGLTRAFTYMSIRCNLEVIKDILKSVLDQLPPDPDIARLLDQVKYKLYSLKLKYKFIKRALKVDCEEYRYKDEMVTVYQEACRCRFHDEELERQLRGEYTEKEVESMLSAEEITDRKVRAIDSMVALASRRELRRPILKKDNEDCLNIPACEEEDMALLNERLSYVDRMCKFSCVSYMMTYVENVHLRREPAGAVWVCYYPECRLLGNFLRSLDYFKSHV
ncbi:hypothetical protein BKA59DRAFT_471345 [Fusarium tricinctum]|uniref:Uncharacterized protein n=1 Tax=Fusarium tricinctum TaxID=61284 RepID=A0A8K0S7B0_9HYPO|nr:hypothetical protein BKA59DRAFT_471345 [Fusarium tricinctum]